MSKQYSRSQTPAGAVVGHSEAKYHSVPRVPPVPFDELVAEWTTNVAVEIDPGDRKALLDRQLEAHKRSVAFGLNIPVQEDFCERTTAAIGALDSGLQNLTAVAGAFARCKEKDSFVTEDVELVCVYGIGESASFVGKAEVLEMLNQVGNDPESKDMESKPNEEEQPEVAEETEKQDDAKTSPAPESEQPNDAVEEGTEASTKEKGAATEKPQVEEEDAEKATPPAPAAAREQTESEAEAHEEDHTQREIWLDDESTVTCRQIFADGELVVHDVLEFNPDGLIRKVTRTLSSTALLARTG